MVADLAVFDPETIADRATYSCPSMSPDGMQYVIVNGKVVVREGRHAGVSAGRLLRKR
jgi:N-acyl-D-aspartate/D-glutamate deacylase